MLSIAIEVLDLKTGNLITNFRYPSDGYTITYSALQKHKNIKLIWNNKFAIITSTEALNSFHHRLSREFNKLYDFQHPF